MAEPLAGACECSPAIDPDHQVLSRLECLSCCIVLRSTARTSRRVLDNWRGPATIVALAQQLLVDYGVGSVKRTWRVEWALLHHQHLLAQEFGASAAGCCAAWRRSDICCAATPTSASVFALYRRTPRALTPRACNGPRAGATTTRLILCAGVGAAGRDDISNYGVR